jgi:hypothetical protein
MTGRPRRSTAHPTGIARPFLQATTAWPSEAVLVAMSSRKGRLRLAGAATAIGFVPSFGSAPKVGTTEGSATFVVTTPIMPCSAAIDAYAPAAPKWPELRTDTTATPCSAAFSTAIRIARSAGR